MRRADKGLEVSPRPPRAASASVNARPPLFDIVARHPPAAVGLAHRGHRLDARTLILEVGVELDDDVLAVRRTGQLGPGGFRLELPRQGRAERLADRDQGLLPLVAGNRVAKEERGVVPALSVVPGIDQCQPGLRGLHGGGLLVLVRGGRGAEQDQADNRDHHASKGRQDPVSFQWPLPGAGRLAPDDYSGKLSRCRLPPGCHKARSKLANPLKRSPPFRLPCPKGAALDANAHITAWPAAIFDALSALEVRQVAYVPDAGHRELITRCQAAETAGALACVPLTTEQEGVALLAGAWLGGQRGVLLMQSSGVGNCVNMLSLTRTCRFPLLMLVTMRGQSGEFNPWQLPMGETTAPVLRLTESQVFELDDPAAAGATVAAAGRAVFEDNASAAVLISQRMIGVKTFEQ